MAQSSMRASSAARAPGEVAVAARSNNNNHNTSNAGVVYGDFLQRRAGVIKRWTKRWAEWNAGTKVLAWYGPQSRKDTRRGGIGTAAGGGARSAHASPDRPGAAARCAAQPAAMAAPVRQPRGDAGSDGIGADGR